MAQANMAADWFGRDAQTLREIVQVYRALPDTAPRKELNELFRRVEFMAQSLEVGCEMFCAENPGDKNGTA